MPSNIVNYLSGIDFVANVYLDSNLLISSINRRSSHFTVASQLRR